MKKSVKKNNRKLKSCFDLEIGNMLSRDYGEKGEKYKVYDSSIFKFDAYEVPTKHGFEEKNLERPEKIISVSKGDIVISLLTHRAVIVRGEEKLFLSPNYIKATSRQSFVSKKYFVYWFNESHEAKKQIEQGNQGSIINKLSIQFLREMSVFESKNSEQIGELYFLTLKKKELLNLLVKKQSELLKGIYQNES